MLICLSTGVLYPINVKTATPIGPKFCVGLHMSTGKVYQVDQNFKNVPPNKIQFSYNVENPRNFFFYKIRNFFVFVLNVYKEKMFKVEIILSFIHKKQKYCK